MKQIKNTRFLFLAVGFGALLFVLLVTGSLVVADTQKRAKSDYGYLNQVSAKAATAKMTDVIAVALEKAETAGMKNSPKEMRIVSGVYREFERPGESDSFYDKKRVHVVWIVSEPYKIVLPGARNQVVSHLYVFVDSETGQAFEFRYGEKPSPQLEQIAWQRVTKADIGKFPVPVFSYDAYLPPAKGDQANPSATETPVSK
ncbi:MAG: hypothetical protein HY741_03030 [Chloroflexi bacterium]|nr:hypothetical protein [Chloroflexota bacterium]